MTKNMKRRAGSIVMAAVLTTSSFAGYGLTIPVSVMAASDEGAINCLYKDSNYYNSQYDATNKYDGDDLGCTYTKEKTTFKVWSPEATKVTLKRYATGSDSEDGAKNLGTVEMTKGDKGVWSCTVEDDIVNTYYTYDTVVGGTTYSDAVDIYAKAVGVNGDRAMVVDLDNTDPDNWDTNYQREAMKISDISVWEVHVRDFSIDVSSGVKEEYKGKYKAFTQTGTTINGEGRVSTCVDYLKDLGVTHVQIMPMYDYASVDETKVTTSLGSNYNWGYDPKNYNAPEGSYSTNPYDGNVRIKEVKEMIQALHDAGIKVIMDVVYNHTYKTRDSNFTKLMPDYYYKLNGSKYNDQSGCGNATRTEAAMYNKFMRESLLYWAEEYNLDGFRFDLMGIHDYNTMNQIRSDMDEKFGDDKIILYGEGWTGDGAYYDNSAHKANESELADDIGFFNDQIRDAIKGEHKFDGTIGLVQTNYGTGNHLEDEKWPNNVFGGIMGSVGYTAGKWGMWRPWWSKSSNSVVAYCSAHDNLTLWDKLTEIEGKNYNSTSDKMLRMNKMAGAVTLVSHGGYFMQAGEEFARTKNGDENSYASSDSVNKIDWTRVDTYSNVQQYYRGMLQIRNVFSGFKTEWTRSGDNWHPNGMNMEWLATDAEGVSAFTMTNTESGEWNKIGVIINNRKEDTTFSLGSGKWIVIADGNTAGLTKIAEYDGSAVKAAGKSVVVAVPKDTFDANPNIGDKLNRNNAPTISGAENQTVAVGDKVEFTVTAKDADGDKVTLTASGIPEGAEFDKATGAFIWEKATAGTHKITFTASDGELKTTKEIIITVTAPTTALKDLVDEIESAALKEEDFTTEVWKNLDNALTEAKAILEKEDATEAECSLAVVTLKVAYTAVVNEKTAKEELEIAVTEAKTKIKASEDGVSKEDAETVLAEAETLIKEKGTAKAYTYAKENLADSVAAITTGTTEPTVTISSPWATSYIYVWTGDGDSAVKYAGKWPGTKLTEKDSDGNYVFTGLEADKEYNIIINDGDGGSSKTEDLTKLSNKITINVATSPSGTKNDNRDVYTAKTKSEALESVAGTLTKESLEAAIKEAKEYAEEYYTEDSFSVLQTAIESAEKVAAESDDQVTVNKETRALRKAMLMLVVKGDVILPSETPIFSETPTATANPTQEPDPDVSASPSTEAPETTAPIAPETTTPDVKDETPEPTTTKVPNLGNDATVIPDVSTEPSATPDGNTEPSATPVATTEPGKVTPIPTLAADLSISSMSFSPSLYQVINKKIKLTVKAEGGNKSYSYKYQIYNANGKLVAEKDYTGKNYVTWKTSKAGTYKFKATVKDADGKTKTKSKSIIVLSKKLTPVSLKATKYAIKQGKTLTFKAKATGGKKAYTYKFVVKNTKGKTVKSSKYIKKNTWKWKATKTGTYKIKVTIKDSLGVKVTKIAKKVRVIK